MSPSDVSSLHVLEFPTFWLCPKNDEEILALIRERRGTNKEHRKHIREVSKKIKKCIRDRRKAETHKKLLEDLKGTKNIPNIKSAKKRTLIPKINNMKGEIITSRKGITDVFGEFCEIIYDYVGEDDERKETESEENTGKTH